MGTAPRGRIYFIEVKNMKISKIARARLKLMTAAEKKKITAAARTLFDFSLISAKRAEMIARNYR